MARFWNVSCFQDPPDPPASGGWQILLNVKNLNSLKKAFHRQKFPKAFFLIIRPFLHHALHSPLAPFFNTHFPKPYQAARNRISLLWRLCQWEGLASQAAGSALACQLRETTEIQPSTFPSLADWCRSYLSYAFSGLQGSPRTWERRLDILLIGTASGFYFQNWESQIVLTAAQEWKELRPLSRSRWPVSEDCGPRWPGSPLQSKSAPSLVSCPRLPINSQCFGWLLGQSDYSLIRHLE